MGHGHTLTVMADMLLEIMNPLYAKHPKLKPPGLK